MVLPLHKARMNLFSRTSCFMFLWAFTVDVAWIRGRVFHFSNNVSKFIIRHSIVELVTYLSVASAYSNLFFWFLGDCNLVRFTNYTVSSDLWTSVVLPFTLQENSYYFSFQICIDKSLSTWPVVSSDHGCICSAPLKNISKTAGMTLNVGEFTQLLSESLAPDRTRNLWCGVPSILLTFKMCCCSSTTVGDCWIGTINQECAKLRESCFGTQGPYQVCKSWITTSPAECKSGQSYRRLIHCQTIPDPIAWKPCKPCDCWDTSR